MNLSSRGSPARLLRLAALAAIVTFPSLLGLGDARAETGSPGLDALEQFRTLKGRRKAVENRFFLKQDRFEIGPALGYVPNNPFAVRYVFGGVLGFHFSETIAAQAQITYSPDLGENDLKGLTAVLLDRAANASNSEAQNFQQPLDKVGLSAAFGLAWAPFYGKINLVGETVLNFDLYGFAGVGMLAKTNWNATYNEQAANAGNPDIVDLEEGSPPNETKVAPVIGVGQNYFLNQLMAFKIDARASFYVDNKPQYDPQVPETEQRLYNNFILSAGLAFFFPSMKPRLYEF